jgi:hypothetical protein
MEMMEPTNDIVHRLRAAGDAAFLAMCSYRDSPDLEVFQDAIDALGMALSDEHGADYERMCKNEELQMQRAIKAEAENERLRAIITEAQYLYQNYCLIANYGPSMMRVGRWINSVHDALR